MAAYAGPTNGGPPLERPLLAPWLRRAASEGRLVLEYGDEIVVLGGERAVALLDGMLPLLDGTRTAADAAAQLGVSETVAHAVVRELQAHGLVVSGPRTGETALLCAALSRHEHPQELEDALRNARVGIVGESSCASELVRLLEPLVGAVSRTRWDDAPTADAAVVAPSAAELPRVASWNERAVELRLPWLQVLPYNGRFAALGPLFVPGETCCQRCYRERRGAALGEPGLFAALEGSPAGYPEPGVVATALAALAATLLARWLASGEPSLPGVLFALELAHGLRIDAHRVLRVPRCPVCSPAQATAAPLPWSAP